jgi:phage terminase large subunit GpA-like protein
VSQWAEKYRVLTSATTAFPGRWRNDRAPYAAFIMDTFNNPKIREVYIKAPSQVLKTESMLNVAGYSTHYEPRPILYLMPTLEMAETFSKERYSGMLKDSPALAEVMAEAKGRDSSNTILYKQFKGGYIVFAGANSAASLSSRSIPIILCDEVSRYPPTVGVEGSPFHLARKRAVTFWDKKIYAASSPTRKDLCMITTLAEGSDVKQYTFLLPCPHCREYSRPDFWKNVVWEEDRPETAKYKCEHCGGLWTDTQRKRAIKGSIPLCLNPDAAETKISFILRGLHSPFMKMSEMVSEYLLAKEKNTPDLWAPFYNTTLGEVYDPLDTPVDEHYLYSRREEYPAEVPAGVLVLCAGVDVQIDCLKVFVIGFGRGGEKWAIDYKKISGTPSASKTWEALDRYREKVFRHELGVDLRLDAVAIDSGGQHTQEVYEYCRINKLENVFAVKGVAGTGRPIVGQVSRRQTGANVRKVELYPVGVDEAKTLVYGSLGVALDGYGFFHFSKAACFDKAFFAELTAEKVEIQYKGSQPVKVWHLPHGRRNEALDTAVYALAAFTILQPDIDHIEASFAEIQAERQGKEAVPGEAGEDDDELKMVSRQPSASNFAHSWRYK